MRRDSTDKTCSLAGTSDLTVIAPIKRGLVPSLDSVTYKTRVKRVLRTLHLSRTLAHEHELARVLSDAVERVGRIHSVRIAVLEPENHVLLAVTFDGAWQSYVRVIWQKVARLLDLIFCNTEGYVLGGESSYEDWGRWLRSAQATTSFLYAAPGVTADDSRYLRMEERLLRRSAGADRELMQLAIPSAEELADRMYKDGIDLTNAGFSQSVSVDVAGRPAFRQALRSLVGLHRLIDVYPEGSEDGRVLRNAARELLPELVRMIRDSGTTYQLGLQRARDRFDETMRWFESVVADPVPEVRRPPPLPQNPTYPNFADIQGGILEPYANVGHGCLLLVAFDSATALAALLDPAVLSVTSAAAPGASIIANIAFTLEGLRLAGLSDDEVEALPEEFVQGMERRAGVLGDLRVNHPLRWNLPAANWGQGTVAPDLPRDDPLARLSLGAVHAVLQLRLPVATAAATPATAPRQLLLTELQRLRAMVPGMRPLSIQWMERFTEAGNVVEHFGYVDGSSQPVFEGSKAGRLYDNQVHLGEVLLGYANAADHAPTQAPSAGSVRELLFNGSFVVVRKLRQDVGAFEAVLGNAVAAVSASANPQVAALGPTEFRAKMMGRWPSGHPQAGEPLARFLPGNKNDFRYQSDAKGELCPFHAHIRRANPRTTTRPELVEQVSDGSRPARLFRRSMPYGPRHIPNPANPGATQVSLQLERGLIFMGYNADIGEQFEVIQRWLSGGNSSAAYSGESDPFLGVAESGRPRYFRFEHSKEAVRVALDGTNRMHDEASPLVRLEWGMYLFAPSLPALRRLKDRAALARPLVPWNAVAGELHIARLRDTEAREGHYAATLAWKAALEDSDLNGDYVTASIFAAIREHHHEVLKTPFGVLVAGRDLVDEVLLDPQARLTVDGYMPRMERSFGGIYLGLDAGRPDHRYEDESEACNREIMSLNEAKTFETARDATRDALQGLVSDAIRHAQEDEEPRWELTIEARELLDKLLGKFCEDWFGLSDRDDLFRKHGYRRDWQPSDPPDYPGHFMAPSRYFFQPRPSPEVERVGANHGVALRGAMTQYLKRFGSTITAPVTRAVLDSPAAKADPEFAARTLAGAIMGFVPTVDGNLRRVLNEWLREDTLGALRSQYAGVAASDLAEAKTRLLGPFVRAMQLCAAPDLLWRTVKVQHRLGTDPTGKDNVDVRPGDVVVAALISATQQSLSEGTSDLSQAFGGVRREPPLASHPTHACPGRGAAMAMMLGFLSALVESPLKWRAGPAPLTLSVDGVTGLPLRMSAPSVFVKKSFSVYVKAAVTPLLVLGDSWLARNMPWGSVLSSLTQHGYGAPEQYYSEAGRTLKAMADPNLLAQIERDLLDSANPPKALLIGGGGNDVSDLISPAKATALYRMLHQLPPPGSDPINYTEVGKFIDVELFSYCETIVDRLVKATSVPILMHAYDHPIPDGQGFGRHNWLKRIFEARQITVPKVASDAMKVLIERLNDMVAEVAKKHPTRVHPVRLAGELAKHYGSNHRLLWENELHAKQAGFNILAAVVAAKLKTLGV